ncbi:MAG: hypothetical protein GX436_09755 [Synergistaceae bacterium]|jgi:hypothetical protein|nr:hypothetical protein [Synergistaceae bacterium]
MSKFGWLILLVFLGVAVSVVVIFLKITPSRDLQGVSIEPAGGGEAVQTESFAGKPTFLIFFTPM